MRLLRQPLTQLRLFLGLRLLGMRAVLTRHGTAVRLRMVEYYYASPADREKGGHIYAWPLGGSLREQARQLFYALRPEYLLEDDLRKK